jgi:hypothetical protein
MPGLLGSLKLPFDMTVIRTAVGLNAQTAAGPQLSLGAEAVRSLQDAQQHGARIGPIDGIWRSRFHAWCFLLSSSSSRRTSRRKDLSASSCW